MSRSKWMALCFIAASVSRLRHACGRLDRGSSWSAPTQGHTRRCGYIYVCVWRTGAFAATCAMSPAELGAWLGAAGFAP